MDRTEYIKTCHVAVLCDLNSNSITNVDLAKVNKEVK